MSAFQAGLRASIVEADTAPFFEAPDTIVEEEIVHWPEVVLPPDWPADETAVSFPLASGPIANIAIFATGGGLPLADAVVRLSVQGPSGPSGFRATTDAKGSCTFALPAGYTPTMALVCPTGGFWPMLVRGNAFAAPIECPALPADGPLGWWHTALGLDAADQTLGQGIRIGVVDTGAGPHACLQHVKQVGTFLKGNASPLDSAMDVGEHGSHVCGTIGARPSEAGQYAGIAPGCELLIAGVFAATDSGASSADIANAIDVLSQQHDADIINLSLGTVTPSQVVQAAIQDAADRGTLCICAAGNNGGAVHYPAAFPEAIAVAALGLSGSAPAGSLSAARLPSDNVLFGLRNLYAANFTSHGASIACAAPGVGILATVPSRHATTPLYGAMDGSSMASPVICAALAICLSRDAGYRALPRDAKRTEKARQALADVLRTVGLPPEYEGRGMPSLGVASS